MKSKNRQTDQETIQKQTNGGTKDKLNLLHELAIRQSNAFTIHHATNPSPTNHRPRIRRAAGWVNVKRQPRTPMCLAMKVKKPVLEKTTTGQKKTQTSSPPSGETHRLSCEEFIVFLKKLHRVRTMPVVRSSKNFPSPVDFLSLFPFLPLVFSPPNEGGIPPSGEDFQGAFCACFAWKAGAVGPPRCEDKCEIVRALGSLM